MKNTTVNIALALWLSLSVILAFGEGNPLCNIIGLASLVGCLLTIRAAHQRGTLPRWVERLISEE